jgi:hypothetical protein
MPYQGYVWTMLNTTVPWSITFNSSGLYPRHLLKFSLSGLPDAADLKVELDGVDLGWTPQPDIGVDRWHYDIYRNETLKDGLHFIQFTLENQQRQGAAQLCSLEVLEFGDQSEYAMYSLIIFN